MEDRYKTVEISKILREMLRRWWVLLFALILFSFAAYYITLNFMTPIYRASVTVFIGREGELERELTIADITLSQRLAMDYHQLIMTELVIGEVINRLPEEHRNVSVGRNLIVNIVDDSRFLYVFFEDPNPERAALFINTLSEVLKEKSEEIFGITNMRIIDYAHIPVSHIRPSLRNNTLVGGFLGFTLAAVIILLLLVYNDTVQNPENIEKELGLRVLGIIPKAISSRSKNKQWTFDAAFAGDPLLVERFRFVQANLNYINIDKNIKILLVTSALPDEGKSSSIANLAYILANSGKKVLLVDADLRKGTLHSAFKVSRSPGLTNYLINDYENEDGEYQFPEYGELDLVTTGVVPPNPSEILASAAFEKFINKVKAKYDIVLIDSPPVLPFSDSAFLAKIADGIILVATANKTKKNDLIKTKESLEKINTRILGLLITKAEIPHKESYYSYHGKNRS